jgi:acetyl-CoA carboxylase biotin carboxyl carrier protein
VTVPAPVAIAAPVAAPVATPVASTALVDEGVEIASPMVGTFYVSQDPESPPFVSVGDSIGEDSTVCVIEAMKIFNEINAQCKGTVTKVLVSNGDPVEFGQALFLVKPH